MRKQDQSAGFTLIEALLALAIVAMVVTSTLAWRTGALIDATEARNWRVAREVAQEILSELRAGARETPPVHDMKRVEIPKMREVKDWTYQIAIGEIRIGEIESAIESQDTGDEMDEGERSRSDRRAFQRERDDMRKARQKGVSYYEYREQSAIEEEDRREREEVPASEDEFEEVAVFVFFPNARKFTGRGGEYSHFVLKARLSTLALEGLTPDEAESENGSEEGSSTNSAGGGTEGTGGKGNL